MIWLLEILKILKTDISFQEFSTLKEYYIHIMSLTPKKLFHAHKLYFKYIPAYRLHFKCDSIRHLRSRKKYLTSYKCKWSKILSETFFMCLCICKAEIKTFKSIFFLSFSSSASLIFRLFLFQEWKRRRRDPRGRYSTCNSG